MSLPPPKPEVEDDKISLLSIEPDTAPTAHDEVAKLAGSRTTEKGTDGQDYLNIPRSGPIRPLSPDTFSNLSLDEYELIRPGRRLSQHSLPGSRQTSRARHGTQTWRGRVEAFWLRNKGLALMLLAQVFGTLMNVTTRLLEIEGNAGKGFHPFQILFVRMSITLVLASLWMWYKKTPHFPLGMPEVRWLLIARGFGGFFGVFGMYYSLLYLPLADATVITFLAPSLACWACSILIKEPFTRIEQIAAMVSLFGVVLIARPTSLFSGSSTAPPASGGGDFAPVNKTTVSVPDASNYDNVTPSQRLMAVGIAMLGVLGAACAYTTIRWIGKRAHPLISVNYFAAWCTLVSIVMQLVLPGVGFLFPKDLRDWTLLIFLGLCGFIMVVLPLPLRPNRVLKIWTSAYMPY
ncbi:hypothetical protein LTR04_000245 [Oleoguttula sp. CCFEE 6159]|nr:hypothetical protein LTR04_000245 [Oleoguttula sp. CCFEE 6159]